MCAKKRCVSFLTIAATVVAVTFVSTSAQVLPSRETTFMFPGPVELPGMALPAGSYKFRIANPTGIASDVVQVFDASGKQLAQFFAYPAQRFDRPESPELRFMETPAGVPPAIRTWWHEDEVAGFEFIYPKDAARRLAKDSSEPVLTTKEESTSVDQTKGAGLTRISADGKETNVDAGDKPTASKPSGGRQQGVASPRPSAAP